MILFTGRHYNPSEYVRNIAHKTGLTTCEPVKARRSLAIYAEGITGEYADGVGDLVPALEDRIQIFESRKSTVLNFWDCLKGVKLGLKVLPARLVEHKPAPRFKRALEDDDGRRDGPQAKKSRLDLACY
jgi:hypothetical protein